MRRSYARPTTLALRRSHALQRLLINAICLTHNVSPSLASFELTGRVCCDIDELTFRTQDGPDMAMVQASPPLGEQFAAGQQEATLTVTRAKFVVA